MEMNESGLFQEARHAIEQGDKRKARDLLTRLLKANPESVDYWLWMSSVVETRRERIYCLKEVLKRDPNNLPAQRGMVVLGAAQGSESGIPYELQKKDWEASLKRFSTFDTILLSGAWRPVAMVAGVILLAAIVFGIISWGKQAAKPKEEAGIIETNTPAITQMLTGTPPLTPTMIEVENLGSATPLTSFLQTPYTPTPLYVNTPHPKTEDYRNAIFAYNRGDWLAVIVHMNKVLTTEPEALDAYYYIGEANRFLGNIGEAFNAYNRAIELNKQFAPAYLGRARTKLAESFARNWQSARSDLEKAIQYDPLMGEAYLEIGWIDLQRGEAELAIQSFQKAETYLPDSPLLQKRYAQAFLLTGKTAEAISRAQKALQLDLTDTESYRILAEAYLLSAKPEEALQPLQIYTLYHPEDLEAYTWLGKVLEETGDSEQALKVLNRVLDQDPKIFDALLLRGKIFLSNNRAEQAAADFKAALVLKRNSFEANIGAAQAALALKEFRDASYYAEQARSYAGSDPNKLSAYYYFHAQALEGLGLLDGARRDWNALLDLPGEVVPTEWRSIAKDRWMILSGTITATPEPYSPTAPAQETSGSGEPSPLTTPTHTRMPTLTVSPTQTRMPTATPKIPTATQTRQPTRTPTANP